MISSPPRLADAADVHVRPDGRVLVMPHVLPIVVPPEALLLTVGEWLGVADTP